MRNAAISPKRIAAMYHCISSAAAARMITGMTNSHPSRANGTRIQAMVCNEGAGGKSECRMQNAKCKMQNESGARALLHFAFARKRKRLPTRGASSCIDDRRLRHCVRRFVRSDSRRHLILQMEFPLLQRLLFELFLSSDLVLRDQCVEAIFTPVMFFDPLPELGVFLSEN